MAMASSAAVPSAAGRSSTSTCSWRPRWWSCANSFNGHASAIAGRLARLPGASSRAYCRALLYKEGLTMRYSTGCVRDYIPNGCAGPDLPLTIPEGANFRFWYNLGGHKLFSRWDNGDVWVSDSRDGPGSDMEPNGGSDIPDIYLYAGHGSCQNPPV